MSKQFHFKQFSLAYIRSLIVSTQFNCKKIFLFQAIQFNQTVLIQTIQFSISTQISFLSPIVRPLSGAITPGQSGPGSDGNEGVFHIPQTYRITGTSSSDCLVSYPEHLPLCRGAVGVFYRLSRLGLP